MNEHNGKLVAYKGFDKNWQCRGFQFQIGKTYEHKGLVKRCTSGFHSCEFPLHVFDHYPPGESVFAVVEASGSIDRETDGDTKLASAKLHIKAELKIPELVTAVIQWITDQCDPVKAKHSTGDQSASSATGFRSASSVTGFQSASSVTGDQSASSATGDQSASSATGFRSASSATGDRSASSVTGFQSASSATGDQSASNVKGKNSVAMNIGVLGKAMASEGGAIVLCNHDAGRNIRHIRASKVGENGIKPDVWYRLNEAGEFVEVV